MSINSKKEFEEFLLSKDKNESVFSLLSEDDLTFFKSQLKFNENGIPYKYWGDVMRVSKMAESEFLKSMSEIFGMDEKKFEKRYHSFGNG